MEYVPVYAPTGFWMTDSDETIANSFYYLQPGFEQITDADEYFKVDTCEENCGILKPTSTPEEVRTAVQAVIDYVYHMNNQQFESMKQTVWRHATTTNIRVGETGLDAFEGVTKEGPAVVSPSFGTINDDGTFECEFDLLDALFQDVREFQNHDEVSSKSSTKLKFKLNIEVFPLLYAFQIAAMICRTQKKSKPDYVHDDSFIMEMLTKGDYLKAQFSQMIDSQYSE
jgi:hypothetical protein